eukprot:TRINITY_DN15890_c0_g1_i1.p1 TRINITY_DN15890_c0_g1~~TRINITY_DN15890_c0_g1_i1.p1  ORF type:complete len:169 (+),score=30.80 TRINITY_DN15890_c0_g1_i1:177-683(+)
MLHPEGGHVCVQRYPTDTVESTNPQAPFGGVDVESMSCAAAIARRAGVSPSELATLPDDHEVWDMTAHYLATLCATMVLLVSPERIVLSGGVMKREVLIPKIRKQVQILLNSYVEMPQLSDEEIEHFIVPSKLGDNIGMVGSLVLAQNAFEERRTSSTVAHTSDSIGL